jgi:hypothetical protein
MAKKMAPSKSRECHLKKFSGLWYDSVARGRMSLDDEELFDFLFYLFIYSCDEPMKVAN